MKRFLIVGAAGLALTLQACNAGDDGETSPEQSVGAPPMSPMASLPAPPTPAGRIGPDSDGTAYSTTGRIASMSGQAVTINHQPVEGLGWPAMTMSFQAPDPAMLADLEAGAPVQFSFRKQGEQYVLTEIQRQ